eukprot:56916-Rhodomonas_salina.1
MMRRATTRRATTRRATTRRATGRGSWRAWRASCGSKAPADCALPLPLHTSPIPIPALYQPYSSPRPALFQP